MCLSVCVCACVRVRICVCGTQAGCVCVCGKVGNVGIMGFSETQYSIRRHLAEGLKEGGFLTTI